MPTAHKDKTKQIIGKSETEARQLIKAPIRVVSKDGENLFLTCDYHPDRINLKIEKGKIVEIFYG